MLLHTHADLLAVETYDWGTLRWLCNASLLPGTCQTLGICHLHARQANPPHFHPNCEEVLYVQAGKGRHRLGDDWVEVTAGSVVRIPIGLKHQLINEGDDTLVCTIVFSSPNRQTVFLNE